MQCQHYKSKVRKLLCCFLMIKWKKIHSSLSETIPSVVSWPFWAADHERCSLTAWNPTPGGGSAPLPHSEVAAQTYGNLAVWIKLKKQSFMYLSFMILFDLMLNYVKKKEKKESIYPYTFAGGWEHSCWHRCSRGSKSRVGCLLLSSLLEADCRD